MLEYFKKNREILIEYCKKEGISFEKLMKCPKCYNNEMLGFQRPIISKGTNGMLHDVPETPLLLIVKEGETFNFSKSENILDYLAI